MTRKNNQIIFSASTSNRIRPGELNFIQIFLEDSTFVVKTNGKLDQISKLPGHSFSSFFDGKSKSSKVKIKFEKESKFEVFDFCLDCESRNEEWNELVSGYHDLVLREPEFLEDRSFMFFSHFAKEFHAFQENGKGEGSVALFVDSVLSKPELADNTFGTK